MADYRSIPGPPPLRGETRWKTFSVFPRIPWNYVPSTAVTGTIHKLVKLSG